MDAMVQESPVGPSAVSEIWVDAAYTDQAVPIYRGNPFTEALPSIELEDDGPTTLGQYPDWDPSDALQSSRVRMHMIAQIKHVVQPLSMHLELLDRFSLLLRSGYVDRNPMSARYYPWLAASIQSLERDIELPNLSFSGVALGCSVIGPSGMGKTTAINSVCSLFPQVITHAEYKGRPFICQQVTWLKLDCPHDASVKSLCIHFFEAIDLLLDTDYARQYVVRVSSADVLVVQMARIAAMHGLGVLILDEIQNLNQARSGGERRLLSFLVSLMNRMRVPILFVGTPRADRVFGRDFKQARRVSSFGDVYWKRMANDEEFLLLVGTLMQYQYLHEKVALREDGSGEFSSILNTLYDESQGITALVSGLVMLSQLRALATGRERLSTGLIKSAAKDCFRLIRPFIQALRDSSGGDLRDDVDGLLADLDFSEMSQIALNKPSGSPREPANEPDQQGVGVGQAPNPKPRRNKNAESACELVRIAGRGATASLSAYDALKEAGWIRSLGQEVLGT